MAGWDLKRQVRTVDIRLDNILKEIVSKFVSKTKNSHINVV